MRLMSGTGRVARFTSTEGPASYAEVTRPARGRKTGSGRQMAVSATASSLTFRMVRRTAASVVVIFGVLAYLYGPAASPAMRNSAIDECNAYAQGNYRSFRLTWHVGVLPHWTCWDASRPNEDPVSLGWWTSPFA